MLSICRCGQPIKMANEVLCEDCMVDGYRTSELGTTPGESGRIYGASIVSPTISSPKGGLMQDAVRGRRRKRSVESDNEKD